MRNPDTGGSAHVAFDLDALLFMAVQEVTIRINCHHILGGQKTWVLEVRGKTI